MSGGCEVEEQGWNSGDSKTDNQQPVISDHLDDAQRLELQNILKELKDVLCNKPGRTELTEHKIETGSSSPQRQPPY